MKSLDLLNTEFPELYGTLPFECLDGWYDLLHELSVKVRDHLNNCEACRCYEEPFGPFRVTQVKEKYGTLRYYVSRCCDVMCDIVDEGERASFTVCEACGAKDARIYVDSSKWIYTRCNYCISGCVADFKPTH